MFTFSSHFSANALTKFQIAVQGLPASSKTKPLEVRRIMTFGKLPSAFSLDSCEHLVYIMCFTVFLHEHHSMLIGFSSSHVCTKFFVMTSVAIGNYINRKHSFHVFFGITTMLLCSCMLTSFICHCCSLALFTIKPTSLIACRSDTGLPKPPCRSLQTLHHTVKPAGWGEFAVMVLLQGPHAWVIIQ